MSLPLRQNIPITRLVAILNMPRPVPFVRFKGRTRPRHNLKIAESGNIQKGATRRRSGEEPY